MFYFLHFSTLSLCLLHVHLILSEVFGQIMTLSSNWHLERAKVTTSVFLIYNVYILMMHGSDFQLSAQELMSSCVLVIPLHENIILDHFFLRCRIKRFKNIQNLKLFIFQSLQIQ